MSDATPGPGPPSYCSTIQTTPSLLLESTRSTLSSPIVTELGESCPPARQRIVKHLLAATPYDDLPPRCEKRRRCGHDHFTQPPRPPREAPLPSTPLRPPPAPSEAPRQRHPYTRDFLDDLIDDAAHRLSLAPTWQAFVATTRDPINDFHPEVGTLPHSAAPLLDSLRTEGAPAHVTPAWTQGQRAAALARGAHKSAKDNIPFLREEFTDMIRKGQWTLLPARLVINNPELMLSPIGVVPQRDRRARTICDYTYFNVNADTRPLAPQEAMQFGRALPRLLCADVDCNIIQMLGRWHSDSMIRYLHVQAQPITNKLSARMFNDGHYSFLPTDTVPAGTPG